MPNDGPIRSPKNMRQMCQSHRGWNRLDRINSLGISIRLAVACRSSWWSSSFKFQGDQESSKGLCLCQEVLQYKSHQIYSNGYSNIIKVQINASCIRIWEPIMYHWFIAFMKVQGVRQRSVQELCHLQLPSTTSTELCRCFAPFVPGISIGPFCQQELRRAGIAVVSTKCQGGDEALLARHVGICTRF